MNKINIHIDDGIDVNEFSKIIGFISEGIIRYNLSGQELEIELDNSLDVNTINNEIKSIMKRYVSVTSNETTIYTSKADSKYYFDTAFEDIHTFNQGVIGLSGKALFLYRFFEKSFMNVAKSIECDNYSEKLYPVLLDVEHYQKTGYLRYSPQYSIFCCSACENLRVIENINEYIGKKQYDAFLKDPQYALSPSACFHTYCEYENQVILGNTIISFTQSVFRNEGRFNLSEFGRLLDYHVKEIVFIGDIQFVSEARKKAIDKVIELIEKWNLRGKITTAADAFIIPKMQKYKRLQMIDASKYELRLNYSFDQMLSVASFNFHGTAFTQPFNIRKKGCDLTVTGCVGFGLERWVLAFLKQYGENVENWPDQIREEYYAN